jgi:hypothetical protein
MNATTTITQSNIQMNERKFFHYASNYDKFYYITCQLFCKAPSLYDHDSFIILTIQ